MKNISGALLARDSWGKRGLHTSFRNFVGRRILFAGVFLISLNLLLSGCSATLKQLERFKKGYNAEEYERIAAEEVTCTADDEGCNQVHLIKGNACLILAKRSTNEQEQLQFYSCAADEFDQGIKQTKNWQLKELDLNRPQTYENYCQALRNLQDEQSGTTAIATGERLLAVAEQFQRLEPDHYGAQYFYALARFRKILPDLIEGDPAKSAQLCEELNSILNDLNQTVSEAMQNPTTEWRRYERNFGDLKAKIKLEKEGLENCA